MTLISYEGEFNKAFWLDGFLPNRSDLELIYKTYFRDPESLGYIRNVGEQKSDWLVQSLLEDLRRKHSSIQKCQYSSIYFHHDNGVAPTVSAVVEELEGKSGPSVGRDYRQIITICDLNNEEGLMRSTIDIANTIGLEICEEYSDIKSFTRSVKGLLKLAVEPFAFPEAAAGRNLRQFGFKRLS